MRSRFVSGWRPESREVVTVGTKENPGNYDCLANALPDEPFFILLARDVSAPGKVRSWAYERERAIRRGDYPIDDLDQVAEARALADAMQNWRQANEGRWRSAPPGTGPQPIPGAVLAAAEQRAAERELVAEAQHLGTYQQELNETQAEIDRHYPSDT